MHILSQANSIALADLHRFVQVLGQALMAALRPELWCDSSTFQPANELQAVRQCLADLPIV